LESTFNVPNKCINEIIDEFQFISSCASGPLVRDVVESTLKSHNCNLDSSVVTDLVKNLCQSHPISTSLGTELLNQKTTYLEKKKAKTLQYVPILKSLLRVLNNKSVQEKAFGYGKYSKKASYQTFHDGSYYQKN